MKKFVILLLTIVLMVSSACSTIPDPPANEAQIDEPATTLSQAKTTEIPLTVDLQTMANGNVLNSNTTPLPSQSSTAASEEERQNITIHNISALREAPDMPIAYNEDPGPNPLKDAMCLPMRLEYPLKALDIKENDQLILIITHYTGMTSASEDAYICVDTEKIIDSKDEFCYFVAPRGMTPTFYVAIYQNGEVVEDNVGVPGVHLAQTQDCFKALKKTKEIDQAVIVSLYKAPFSHFQFQGKIETNNSNITDQDIVAEIENTTGLSKESIKLPYPGNYFTAEVVGGIDAYNKMKKDSFSTNRLFQVTDVGELYKVPELTVFYQLFP